MAWRLDCARRCSRWSTPTPVSWVIHDFTRGDDGGSPSDDLVVVEIATGSLIDRLGAASRHLLSAFGCIDHGQG